MIKKPADYCINYCIEEQRKYVLIFLAFNVLYCSILFMSFESDKDTQTYSWIYGGLFLLSPLENGKSTKDECGFKSF
jgi:hypothetical protein